MFDVNVVRTDFPGTTQQVYLNAAGIGLPPKSATQAVQRAATLLGQGPAEMGYPAYYQALGKPSVQARQEAARLLRAQPHGNRLYRRYHHGAEYRPGRHSFCPW